MKIDLLTLFPEMFVSPLQFSLLKKAQEKKLVEINIVNIRDFTLDKHKTADDSPFGGGSGMVMKAEPLIMALGSSLPAGKAGVKGQVILMTPSGKKIDQETAKRLAREKHLTIICGHYEGVDQRFVDKYVDEELSIGDYVLTGGELPALVLIDAVCRLIPGVVKEADSIVNDSFYNGLLDYPSYTRPEEFEGIKIPEVLKSGNHREIARWRRKEALKRTLLNRPELLASAGLKEEDKKLLEELILE
ncbi:tRNA (guanosine(37)-N1)-methyltransferase TrmD [candidate division WOR-1 bacterium RIFOXYA12_FULL_43_27]|uniref:tRNA (guanine-N(1)-)-methyltransferase n=1 Tax=candidate division WOR-1 bacterium RIFOXYC2_FULL_46_14 TaxID=1802587 RepID=A0A1F4U5B6_UNCSA|nr:MAG: tRNA (guanosine(37)-N1)-methyltransferase TrmD [candidate division WOR-1 bacterium RIFOXYA12_FULL_43_27]OGC20658.1 MAG: tRNA (guanosine(37)-N1)-methyltransferase TrmD [candidate division WOR-1 bacterium RIFOXYB2_FULL_46_45]OGC31605.1 MAG: tRNA (guanosine(37)-N1)-methyltransferase TrmD [candidate division WOR-1 bacterium RIFOXYA2_FULL_46_56]OGC40010.1 MAG: tRNA (guanosine(37)-N1)-methyltransferase TrmD [candidate division WOR-1 bacterium RIFOXYC2_FULL_46_14]